MNNLEKLIRLNVELEGILRVLQARQSDEALTAAREKFAEFSTLFGSLTDEEYVAEVANVAEVAEVAEVADVAEVAEVADVADESDESCKTYKSYTPDDAADAPAIDECIVVEDHTNTQAAAYADGYRDIRRNLTLNDKFMFKRELFNDSTEEFNDTLDLISAMSSYDEALEYLCDDLAWDPEAPAVKEFLNLAANYFNTKR